MVKFLNLRKQTIDIFGEWIAKYLSQSMLNGGDILKSWKEISPGSTL